MNKRSWNKLSVSKVSHIKKYPSSIQEVSVKYPTTFVQICICGVFVEYPILHGYGYDDPSEVFVLHRWYTIYRPCVYFLGSFSRQLVNILFYCGWYQLSHF